MQSAAAGVSDRIEHEYSIGGSQFQSVGASTPGPDNIWTKQDEWLTRPVQKEPKGYNGNGQAAVKKQLNPRGERFELNRRYITQRSMYVFSEPTSERSVGNIIRASVISTDGELLCCRRAVDDDDDDDVYV